MQSNEINFKGIFIFLAALVLALLAVYWAIGGMARGFENRASRIDAATLSNMPSRALNASLPYFPGPREQPNPVVDLQTLRAREDAAITNYRWINRTAGVVQIPIARAMDLVLAKQQEAKP